MSIDSEVLDSTIYRLLGKAGLDPRCTPAILRAKTEQKLKLEKDALLVYRVRIKKLIVKWWKETQMGDAKSGDKRPVAADSSSAKKIKKEGSSSDAVNPDLEILTKYKAWRQYTKALNQHVLLEGLTEISAVEEKVAELRKRLSAAGFKCSNPPTGAEIAAAEKEHA